jgi:hypothetical protein
MSREAVILIGAEQDGGNVLFYGNTIYFTFRPKKNQNILIFKLNKSTLTAILFENVPQTTA